MLWTGGTQTKTSLFHKNAIITQLQKCITRILGQLGTKFQKLFPHFQVRLFNAATADIVRRSPNSGNQNGGPKPEVHGTRERNEIPPKFQMLSPCFRGRLTQWTHRRHSPTSSSRQTGSSYNWQRKQISERYQRLIWTMSAMSPLSQSSSKTRV